MLHIGIRCTLKSDEQTDALCTVGRFIGIIIYLLLIMQHIHKVWFAVEMTLPPLWFESAIEAYLKGGKKEDILKSATPFHFNTLKTIQMNGCFSSVYLYV